MNLILNAVLVCLSLVLANWPVAILGGLSFASATYIEATGYLPDGTTDREELRLSKLQVECLLSLKLGLPYSGAIDCRDPVHDAPFEVLYIASHLITIGEEAFKEGKYSEFVVAVEALKAHSEAVLSLSAR